MVGISDEALGLPELSRDQLLRRLTEPDGSPDALRAVREIVRRGLPEGRAALQEVVAKEPGLPPTKVAAIRALGAMFDPEAEEFLLSRVGEATAAETGQIARALARSGSEKTLEVLSGVRLEPETSAARVVINARRFIAFRSGRRGEEIDASSLPRGLPLERGAAQEIKHRGLDAQEIEASAKTLRSLVPELDLSTETALELVCKGAVQWLVPQKWVADPGQVEDAVRRPGVAFVLLSRDRCVDGLFFDSYVLSQPERDGSVGLYVTRLAGDITHAGRAAPSDRGFDFRFEALNIRRNPGGLALTGQLDRRGRFELSEAFSGIARAEGQVKPRQPRSVAEPPT